MLKINNNYKISNFRKVNISNQNNVCFFLLNKKDSLLKGKYFHLSNLNKFNFKLSSKVNSYLYFFKYNFIFKFLKEKGSYLDIKEIETEFVELVILNNYILNINVYNLQLYLKLFDLNNFHSVFIPTIFFVFSLIIYYIYFVCWNINFLLLNFKKL